MTSVEASLASLASTAPVAEPPALEPAVEVKRVVVQMKTAANEPLLVPQFSKIKASSHMIYMYIYLFICMLPYIRKFSPVKNFASTLNWRKFFSDEQLVFARVHVIRY